ncbi:MAG TPA: hypothetical protein VF306_10495, partial [Pirellulales bacterium]
GGCRNQCQQPPGKPVAWQRLGRIGKTGVPGESPRKSNSCGLLGTARFAQTAPQIRQFPFQQGFVGQNLVELGRRGIELGCRLG